MFHLLIYNHVVLHPEKKMLHFKKYWSKPLQADVLELLEAKVRSSHIFIIFLPSDISHSSLRGTIVSTPSPPCILIPHPLKRNPASVTTYATLYSQRRFSRRLSVNCLSNRAELPKKVLDSLRV